jgi:hypothetical protein
MVVLSTVHLLTVSSEHVKYVAQDLLLVGPLTFLVNTIAERIVDGWLVEIARRMGSVLASHFDSYNEF